MTYVTKATYDTYTVLAKRLKMKQTTHWRNNRKPTYAFAQLSPVPTFCLPTAIFTVQSINSVPYLVRVL